MLTEEKTTLLLKSILIEAASLLYRHLTMLWTTKRSAGMSYSTS